jgi:hypothetical protein
MIEEEPTTKEIHHAEKLIQTLLLAAMLSPTVAMAQLLPPKPTSECPTGYEWRVVAAAPSFAGSGDTPGWLCCNKGICISNQ